MRHVARWGNALRLGSPTSEVGSDCREDFFEERAVGAGVGGGLGGGRADLTAFDHNGAVEAAGFKFFEDGGEIHFARAELDHHVGFGFPVGSRLNRAVFGAKPGDVREDRREFGDRIFARVIDDVAGVIPNFEIGGIQPISCDTGSGCEL